MHVLLSDINRRISSLSTAPRIYNYMESAKLFTDKGKFCENNAINSILNWESLAESTDSAFNKALDIFDELCINSSNKSIIRSSSDVLCEGINKVRDQNQLKNSLKYRMGVLKRKPIAKLTNKYADVTDQIKANLNKIKSSDISIGGTIKSGDIAHECYTDLLNKCKLVIECDRILFNYNNISKRFNLDRIISEVKSDTDCYMACNEIAACIDTYNTPFKNKYNTALEVTAYVFDKHFMNYDKYNIIEAVTDYFVFNGSLKENDINDVRYVKKISTLFESSDFESITWLTEEEDTAYEGDDVISGSVDDYGVDVETLTEADLAKTLKDKKKDLRAFKKDVKKSTRKLVKDAKTGNPEERRDEDIKKMVDDFRKQCVKDPEAKTNFSGFKALINRIFTKSPTQIVYELPNIFVIVRAAFIISAASFSPVIGLIAFITNELIKCGLSRKQLDKVIKAYKAEISSVKSKIEKTKDKDTKEHYEKYLAELKKDLEKIETYSKDLYTEEENDERDAANSDDDYNFDDDDWDDDDWDDDDWDFEEASRMICIGNYISSISEQFTDADACDLDGIIHNNIYKLDNDSIDTLTDLSIAVPVVIDKDKLKQTLIDYRTTLREARASMKNYIRIDCINENLDKLNKSGYSYNTSKNSYDIMLYLACVNEIAKINNSDYVLEMDFTNTIKLAVNNLKRNAIKLSDKEKQISNNIDVSANNVSKSIEDALMSGNREAVIRGRMIPSASKTIKWALGLGIAWAINPALSVIAAIGAFACSKKLQAKERQLILDDIDIELKMCERYIRQYEDKGDLKKVRQCEQIQRSLERQKQRIKYKMITVYHQKVPDVKNED